LAFRALDLLKGGVRKMDFVSLRQECGGCECPVSAWDIPAWQRAPGSLLGVVAGRGRGFLRRYECFPACLRFVVAH